MPIEVISGSSLTPPLPPEEESWESMSAPGNEGPVIPGGGGYQPPTGNGGNPSPNPQSSSSNGEWRTAPRGQNNPRQSRPDIRDIQMGEFRAYWALVQDDSVEFDPTLQYILEMALANEPAIVGAVYRSASPEAVLQTLFALAETDLSAEKQVALVDRLLIQPYTPPIKSHAVEPEGVVWGPSVDLEPIRGVPQGFWVQNDSSGIPEKWWPAQYGNYNYDVYAFEFGANACWLFAAYSLLSDYANSREQMEMPSISDFIHTAQNANFYTGGVTTEGLNLGNGKAEGSQIVARLLSDQFNAPVIYTGDVYSPTETRTDDQIGFEYIRDTLNQGLPIAVLSSQRIDGGLSGVLETSPNLLTVDPLASGGANHWVVVTAISSGKGFVRVYNPYLNRIEYYALDDFMNTLPSDERWELFWIDPNAENSDDASWNKSYWTEKPE